MIILLEDIMYRPWLNKIEQNKRILEIGPLCNPNIKKNGTDVFYADIRSTEDVKEFYKNDKSVAIENIVDIDFVIEGGYSESLKNIRKFDYVIATHVIEHIPQLILFFMDISNILNYQGKLCLTIPDKRYCFDHFRQPTSFAECYDIYTKEVNNLPFRVLDFFISAVKNDPVYWWNETSNFDDLPQDKDNRFDSAKRMYLRALEGEYLDVHFSVFTPESFLLLLYNMLIFNLLPFRCIEFYKTEINTLEFNCVLEYDPDILNESSKERENIIKLLNDNCDLYNSNMVIESLKADLNAVLSSKSWKITAPLRKVKKTVLRIWKKSRCFA